MNFYHHFVVGKQVLTIADAICIQTFQCNSNTEKFQ